MFLNISGCAFIRINGFACPNCRYGAPVRIQMQLYAIMQ
jgi:hypothetical protein